MALKEKIQSLETTIHELNSKPKFELSDHKDKDHDIAVYTGFPTIPCCYVMTYWKRKLNIYATKIEMKLSTTLQNTTNQAANVN